MRAEAATALTSSSRSCRPTVMAGSTRGSKTEIRSWDTEEQTDETQQRCMGYKITKNRLYSDISPHAAHILTDKNKLSFCQYIYPAIHIYLWPYGTQIKNIVEPCSAYLRAHHIDTEQVVPVGQPGHTWYRAGLHDGPPTGLLLAASTGRLPSWKHQFHSCGEGPHQVSVHTSPWQEPPPGKQGKT